MNFKVTFITMDYKNSKSSLKSIILQTCSNTAFRLTTEVNLSVSFIHCVLRRPPNYIIDYFSIFSNSGFADKMWSTFDLDVKLTLRYRKLQLNSTEVKFLVLQSIWKKNALISFPFIVNLLLNILTYWFLSSQSNFAFHFKYCALSHCFHFQMNEKNEHFLPKS